MFLPRLVCSVAVQLFPEHFFEHFPVDLIAFRVEMDAVFDVNVLPALKRSVIQNVERQTMCLLSL